MILAVTKTNRSNKFKPNRVYPLPTPNEREHKIVWEEVSNNGTLKVTFYKLLIFILKLIAPIAISLIFIKELGFLKL